MRPHRRPYLRRAGCRSWPLPPDRPGVAGCRTSQHARRPDRRRHQQGAARSRGAELPTATYEFARAAGMSVLASDVSLTGHNIVDGEMLVLMPAGAAERYGPVVENVSTALAQYASEHFVRVTAETAIAVAVGIMGAALAVAAALLWRLRWATESSLLVTALLAAAAVVLVGTAVLATRLGAPRVVSDGAAWGAIALATLAATTVPSGKGPGAPHAFLAAVTAVAGNLAAGAVDRPVLVGRRRGDHGRRGGDRRIGDPHVLGGARAATGGRDVGRGAGRGGARRRWRCGWPRCRARPSGRSPAATSSRALRPARGHGVAGRSGSARRCHADR